MTSESGKFYTDPIQEKAEQDHSDKPLHVLFNEFSEEERAMLGGAFSVFSLVPYESLRDVVTDPQVAQEVADRLREYVATYPRGSIDEQARKEMRAKAHEVAEYIEQVFEQATSE